MSKCSDAKTGGTCSDIVDTAINVCEEKQKDHEITHKTLKNSQETSFSRNTNFGQLISQYRDTEKSAKKSVSSQKACADSAKALKKDCEKKCEDDDSSGCENGQQALDDIKNFCKKKQEEAEAIAEQAAFDAASIEAAAKGITSDSSSSAPTIDYSTKTGPTTVTTTIPRATGSQGLNSFLNVTGTPIENATDDGSNSGVGGGVGGSTSGSGGSADGIGLVGGTAGDLGGAKNKDGNSSKSAADNAADLAAAAARYGSGAFPDKSKEKEKDVTAAKSAEGPGGYMFLGTPRRKKARPSLLNRTLTTSQSNKGIKTTTTPATSKLDTEIKKQETSTNLDTLK